MNVPDDDLKALFDIAIGSYNFGSGFLDNAEVECLRRIAVQIGVDPMTATPRTFATQYRHAFDPWATSARYPVALCTKCGADGGHVVHALT